MHKLQILASRVVGLVLSGRNLDLALDETRRTQPQLSPQQRAALQDMSYTTLRWLNRLEALLSSLIERPLKDERLRLLLLVAVGQLEYGKSAPHAVVDHAVKAANELQLPWAKGLVNGVLRNFLRQQEMLTNKIDKNLQTRLSYPNWWIEKLKRQYSDEWEVMLCAGNTPPPMSLRVNLRKISRDNYLSELASTQIAAEAYGTQGIRLHKPCPVDQLPGFREGYISVQDLGAQHAAPLLQVEHGMRVLDACSAPGGKACHLLELADIQLLALDKEASRLEKVTSNLQRLDLKAELREADASQPETWWDGIPFDRILADVPCTASGIVRRHPDIKWLRRERDIPNFTAQQREILHGLWSTLAKGGKLLYATCSVFHEENREQVSAFLAETPDARTVSLDEPIENQLLPCDDHDGFYYALLQKI